MNIALYIGRRRPFIASGGLSVLWTEMEDDMLAHLSATVKSQQPVLCVR